MYKFNYVVKLHLCIHRQLVGLLNMFAYHCLSTYLRMYVHQLKMYHVDVSGVYIM